jgi:MYXO-CTERM domain-containing protein
VKAIAILFLALAPLVALAGCGAADDSHEQLGSLQEAVKPPTEAHCSIVVTGKGTKSMEDDYLPRVITCENGGANLQALKAQAIAARSVAYYAIATSGSICDGQGCQVYTCGAQPSAKHYQAVKETAGVYLSYGGMLTYGFYVAGDSNASPPGCKDYSGSTVKYITYNEGKTGTDVTQTSLGFIGPPGYGQNRGCMGQWGARCLENGKGYDYKKILQFYYGADIKLLQATGPCTSTCTPTTEVCNGKDDDCDGQIDEGDVCNQAPKGYLDEVSCEAVRGWAQDPDEPGKSIDVHLYFGGPAGSGAKGSSLSANLSRQDLCSALGSCEHGYELGPPLSLFDGQPHAVHAYGIDSAGGKNAELANSPKTLACSPSLPSGIRRHVTSPDSLAAWKFDLFWQMLPLTDAQIAGISSGDSLPDSPALVQADDGSPEVWLHDGKFRRHVGSPTVMAAWSFAFGDVVQKPAAEVSALDEGPPVRAYPVLVRDSGGKVELIDDPLQPPTGGSGAGGFSGGTATGGAGSGASAGGSGAKSQAQQTQVLPDGEGSCGCRQPGSAPNHVGWLGLLLIALPFVRRRLVPPAKNLADG